MASKTIMVDLEAYNRLKSARATNESFSGVIKRLVRPAVAFRDLEKCLSKHRLSREAIHAVERQIRSRRRPSKRSR